MPESVCTRCDDSLIPKFQEAGDWCAEHAVPESQCTICHPDVKKLWEALNPALWPDKEEEDQNKVRRTASPDSTGLLMERPARVLDAGNDPICPVDTLRVRFVDAEVVRKAGIEVERAARRTMSAVIEVPAEVEFDATRMTRVTPQVGGLVREVPVQEGDWVATRDILAVLDSPALGEAKSEYIQRVQDWKLARADFQRLDAITRGVRQLLEVCTPEASAGQIRQALADSPVGEAKAKLLRAHAALQLARAEAERQASLIRKNISSEKDHQAAQSALAAAEAEFIAWREEIALTTERDLLAAARAVEITESTRAAAGRKLHILGLTEPQIDGLDAEADEQLTRFELHSPIAGRIIERTVAAGESVERGDVLFLVADTSRMWLVADVSERDLPLLRTGLPVLFTMDGSSGASFEGKTTWISSRLDDRTRTVRTRADLPNPDGLLRAKMFGRARIVIHENEEVISVPIDAVQTDGCCQLVFVQESETVFQPRKVLLGARANGYVEVLRGLEPGEAVASTGSFLMKTEILKSNIGAGCCEVDPGR